MSDKIKDRLSTLISGFDPFTKEKLGSDSIWRHPTVIEQLSQIMSEDESKTAHSTIPEYEEEGRIFYRLEDEKDFPATGLSKEELIEKRINNWKNDVLLNRGFKITDLEKDRLEKMFETTKNLDKLEAYFQRSRRSLVVMLEDRGINFFSEKQCERCDNFIPQARLEAVPQTSLCVTCANNDPSGEANRRVNEPLGTREDFHKDRKAYDG